MNHPSSGTLTLFHIPVCPFCQRLEILLALKGMRDAVRFEVVDITKPRDPALLAKAGGGSLSRAARRAA